MATYQVTIRKTVVLTQTVVVEAKNKKQAELAAQADPSEINAATKTAGWKADPASVVLVGEPTEPEVPVVKLSEKAYALYQAMLAENGSNGGDFGVAEAIVSRRKKAAFGEMMGTMAELAAIPALGIAVHETIRVNDSKKIDDMVTQFTMGTGLVKVVVG